MKSAPEELVKNLRYFLSERSIPAYLVGGSVRDILMKRPLHDIDIVIKGSCVDVGSELGRVLRASLVHLGNQHQIVRLVLPIEYGRFTIDIAALNGEIEEDLARRDFTIDAIAMPLLFNGHEVSRVIDPLDGQSDIEKGLVRVVSSTTFQDDPVRLLRGPRLAAQLRFDIEKETSDLIKSNAALISQVAGERVRDELMKILSAPDTAKHLRLMDDLGLLCLVIPELKETVGVVQPKEHYWDVFHHCIEASGAVDKVLIRDERRQMDPVLTHIPWDNSFTDYFNEEVSDGYTRCELLKLCALLHDVGKPQTKTIESTGRMRFFGHSEAGAKIAEVALERLRFSRRGVVMVSRMITNHLRPGQLSQRGEMPTRRALFKYIRDMGDVALDTIYLNLADYLAARGPNIEFEDWERHCGVIKSVIDYKLSIPESQTVYKLLNGHDIMQAFGLSSGKTVGDLLVLVQEAHGAGEISTKEEALDLIRANLTLKEDDA